MRLKKLEDADSEPVNVDQVKQDLILAGDADDELLADYIKSFRQFIEEFTKTSILTQTWQVSFTPQELEPPNDEVDVEYIPDRFLLPRPPIQSIESVTYTTIDGETTALTVTTDYRVEDDILVFEEPEYDGYYTIVYVAGYDDEANVPTPILQGIRIATSAHYENREAFVLPPSVKRDITPYKRGRWR